MIMLVLHFQANKKILNQLRKSGETVIKQKLQKISYYDYSLSIFVGGVGDV